MNQSAMNTMLSSTSQWYDHFRGALYPLDLNGCCDSNKTKTVSSLVHLAADFIVKDSTMTQNAVKILPQELCSVLMHRALEGNRDRSVNILLTKWPYRTLTLKMFAPNIFSDLSLLHDHVAVTRVAKQGLRYTTCVAHNFLEVLKGGDTSHLKYIDMTGYPTAEVITYFLATHTMLAHNETRQNVMIQKYENALKQLSPEEAPEDHEKFATDRTIPDDKFIVKLDVFITSEHALFEVCKALKVSSFKDSTLKIFVDKLDATCLGAQKITILLDQLNVQHLHGLRLKYNSLSSEDFLRLSPVIATFTELSSLDLSCNCINIFSNDAACDEMGRLFASLPHLIRLDLSNNRIKTKLRRVLSHIVLPLQFLRLAGCGLTQVDMAYLSESHHTQGLSELDISENGLWNSFNELCHLLLNIRDQISVLELEDSGLTDKYIDWMISRSVLKQLRCLSYLNISGNSMLGDSMYRVCQEVARLGDIQYLCLSYPRDSYDSENTENQERQQTDVKQVLEGLMRDERLSHNLSTVPKLVFSHLDHEMQG